MKKRIYFFLAALFILFAIQSQAQISKGKNFWFGFMQNIGETPTTEYRVYITSDQPATGIISSPLQGWSQNFTVTPGTSTLIVVPQNIGGNSDQNNVSNKALHVVTDQCVSVFLHNFENQTSDAAVVFPINSVGDDYIVSSYSSQVNPGNPSQPEFLIAATDGPTQVSITLPVSTQGHTAGVPYTISLDTGEVYQLQSANGDLTGTRITALNGRNVAVFGGHVCADVICTACDHLVEQMYPIATWGTEYVTVPLMTRPYDVFRIVASVNGTQYSVNGTPSGTLNTGQFADIQLSAVSTITSTNPISVTQYSIGASCNTNGSTDGDPFIIMLSPTSQNIAEVTFGCFPGSGLTYYLNVVAKTNDVGTVTLDGTSIGANFLPVPGNPQYSSLQMVLTQTDHTILSNQGVQAYVYAYGSYESFGYSAGVRVQVPFLSIYDTTRAYCPTDTVYISLNTSDTSRIIYSEWDLGDGSPHLYDTFSFWHIYSNYGDYPVQFIYEVVGACTRDTLTIDTIKIRGPEPDLGGPYNLCTPQNITINPTYRFPPDSIFWTVGTTTFVNTDTNFVYSFYADKDTVISIRVKSQICDGFDTAYVYVAHDTAGFTFANACEGMPVTFTNTSQVVPGLNYQWLWDYGDGTTSISSNTTHTHQYTAGGTYTVKLRLMSPSGCADSITHPLTIYAQPHAWFIADPVCNTNILTPRDSTIMSAGTPTYEWYFGDGTPVNTSPNPSHAYSQSGGYLVTLIASSPGCSDTAAYMVNINIGADMAFTAPSICWGNISTFTDASINNSGSAILDYRWDFGDGNTAIGATATNNYAAPGAYTIKLVHDYGFNCFDSITRQHFVNTVPTAAFTVADVCNSGTVAPVNGSTINPVTGMTYSWLFGDNTAAQSGNAPPHTYAMSGAYAIQLIATSDSLCADTITQPVNVIRGTNIAFSAPPVCEGDATVFTDQTANPYNTTIVGYNWDFGDGTSANTQNTTHTYAAGTYNAELLLDYGSGCADSLTQQVTVYVNPVAAFTVSDVCNDSVVTPVNTSTGATSYTWNFADGSAPVTGNAPAHTYHNSNQYTIQLIAQNAGGCADTVTNNVRVIIGTLINFVTGPVCEGATTVFTDQTTNPYSTTINTYAWDFGDGTTAATQNTTHAYATPSTYNVELKLDYGFNCLDSITKQVAVNTNPVADFTFTIPCNGTAVQYTNASTSTDPIAAYDWQFGDGGSSVVQNPSHLYGTFGTYNTKLVVYTVNGCTDSITKPVTVLEVGTAQFSVAPVCIANASEFHSTIDSVNYPVSSYTWNLGEGPATGANPTHAYSTAGTHTVTLIANFANGCADTATGTAIVNALPVVSAAITNVSCFGYSDGSVIMSPVSGQPAFAYTWSTSPVNTPNNTNVPAGTYDLTVTDGNTCTTTGSYVVTQPAALLLDTATSPISCFGYTDGGVTLSPSGATQPYTYVWNNGETGQNLFGVGAGTYSVTVTDAEGCTVSAAATLNDPLLFRITNTEDVTVDLGKTITLTAEYENGNPAQWLWSPADNMTCPTCQTTEVLTYNNITYTVIAVTDLGCVDTAIVRVVVDPKRVVFVPNVFTPNGDGANDYFEVYGNKEAWKQFEVQVYNRIGEKVFESNDKDFKWDGIYKGVLQNPAVYVYVVKVIYLDNFTDMTYKGSVTLMR